MKFWRMREHQSKSNLSYALTLSTLLQNDLTILAKWLAIFRLCNSAARAALCSIASRSWKCFCIIREHCKEYKKRHQTQEQNRTTINEKSKEYTYYSLEKPSKYNNLLQVLLIESTSLISSTGLLRPGQGRKYWGPMAKKLIFFQTTEKL